MRILLEGYKVELGLGGSVLEQSYDAYGHLVTPGWIPHTWKFLSDFGMTIKDKVGNIKLQREGDQFLTEVFYEAGYRGYSLRRLNLCRLFLQVTTVSDVVTGDGTQLTNEAKLGTRERLRVSQHGWPYQGKPGPSTWEAWRKALGVALCGGERSSILK
jgi:hypothetical protein